LEVYEGNTYLGEWDDGNKTGYGIMMFSDGEMYFGEWDDGYYDGSGFNIDS